MLYEKGGAGVIDDSINLAWNTTYYLTTDRAGAVITCKIYSDAARTVLVDTISGACAATTCRYAFGCASYDTSTAGKSITFDVYDMDLQEGAETHAPTDTAKASDDLVFKAEMSIADTAKASDSLVSKVEMSIADTAKASDSLITKVKSIFSDIAKASDIISFVKNIKYATSDTAKASDTVSFTGTGIGDIFKYPIRAIRDKVQKYSGILSRGQKYKTKKNRNDFKYYIKKDD